MFLTTADIATVFARAASLCDFMCVSAYMYVWWRTLIAAATACSGYNVFATPLFCSLPSFEPVIAVFSFASDATALDTQWLNVRVYVCMREYNYLFIFI